jgi:MFS family permease
MLIGLFFDYCKKKIFKTWLCCTTMVLRIYHPGEEMKAVVAETDKASSQTLGQRQVNKAALIRLGIVFLLSGASSLLYQVGWQRLLTINYGVGPVSVTLIVSMYMLGLGLGALAGGAMAQRYAGRSVLIYCLCEALQTLGLASIPILQWLATPQAVPALAFIVFVFAPFSACPILMGMTLPFDRA